jgi:AraC family transcriptional regulator
MPALPDVNLTGKNRGRLLSRQNQSRCFVRFRTDITRACRHRWCALLSCFAPLEDVLIECATGEDVKRAGNNSRVVVDIATSPMVLDLIEQAATTLDCDLDAARQLLLRAAAVLRARGVPRERAVQPSAGASAQLALAPWQLDRISTYIEENIGGSLRNAHLAKLIYLSTSHFSRAFAGSAGVSPARYVRRRRIQYACRLMISTRLSLCQIAIAAGLSDQAHLCRTFRFFFSDTPRIWRRANTRAAPGGGQLQRVPVAPAFQSAIQLSPRLRKSAVQRQLLPE